jgi:hypothetical protein
MAVKSAVPINTWSHDVPPIQVLPSVSLHAQGSIQEAPKSHASLPNVLHLFQEESMPYLTVEKYIQLP